MGNWAKIFKPDDKKDHSISKTISEKGASISSVAEQKFKTKIGQLQKQMSKEMSSPAVNLSKLASKIKSKASTQKEPSQSAGSSNQRSTIRSAFDKLKTMFKS